MNKIVALFGMMIVGASLHAADVGSRIRVHLVPVKEHLAGALLPGPYYGITTGVEVGDQDHLFPVAQVMMRGAVDDIARLSNLAAIDADVSEAIDALSRCTFYVIHEGRGYLIKLPIISGGGAGEPLTWEGAEAISKVRGRKVEVCWNHDADGLCILNKKSIADVDWVQDESTFIGDILDGDGAGFNPHEPAEVPQAAWPEGTPIVRPVGDLVQLPPALINLGVANGLLVPAGV